MLRTQKIRRNMRETRVRERWSGGPSRALLRQPRRSFSLVERHYWGGWGPARVAENGGDREDWSVVRSRKRKATKHEFRGRDRARIPNWHGGQVTGYGMGRLHDSDRVSKAQLRFNPVGRVEADRRGSKNVGGRTSTSKWHGSNAGVTAGD